MLNTINRKDKEPDSSEVFHFNVQEKIHQGKINQFCKVHYHQAYFYLKYVSSQIFLTLDTKGKEFLPSQAALTSKGNGEVSAFSLKDSQLPLNCLKTSESFGGVIQAFQIWLCMKRLKEIMKEQQYKICDI